jgi:hypothetical protein
MYFREISKRSTSTAKTFYRHAHPEQQKETPEYSEKVAMQNTFFLF